MKDIIAKYGFSELIAKGGNLLLSLLLARILTSQAYGEVALIISIEQILISFIVFNQQTVILRFFSFFENNRSHLYFSSLFIIAVISGIVLLCYFIIFLPINYFFSLVSSGSILLIVFGSIIQGTFHLHLAYLRAGERVAEYGRFRVLNIFLKFTLIILFALFMQQTLSYSLSFLIAGCMLSLIIIFKYKCTIKSYAQKFLQKIEFPREQIKKNFQLSIPLTITGSFGVLYSVIDRFVLQYFLGSEQVGIYYFAFLLGTISIFVLDVFSLAYVPRIYQGSEYSGETEKYLRQFMLISILSLVVLSIFIFFVIFPISLTFVDQVYSSGRIVVLLILISSLFDPVRLYGTYKLTFFQKVTWFPFIGVVAFVGRFVLCLLFIPGFGILGAGIAVLLSGIIQSFITLVIAQLVQKNILKGAS